MLLRSIDVWGNMSYLCLKSFILYFLSGLMGVNYLILLYHPDGHHTLDKTDKFLSDRVHAISPLLNPKLSNIDMFWLGLLSRNFRTVSIVSKPRCQTPLKA